MPKLLSTILGVVLLLIIFSAFVFLVWAIGSAIFSLQGQTAIAVVAGSATVLAATITVVVGRYFERKKEIEAHFRTPQLENFDALLKLMFDLTHGGDASESDKLVKALTEWQRKLILYAGPKTILAFVEWKRELTNPAPRLKSFLLMAKLFKSIRADLGLSNRGVSEGDFAHLILRNADLFNSLAQKNPDATFDELVELEKVLLQTTQKI